MKKMRVAVVQDAPVLFNRAATIEKVGDLTATAASQGAQLVLFPEAFIPAYPRGLTFGTIVGSRTNTGRKTWYHYWNNSIDLQGPEAQQLGAIARDNKVLLAIGVIEKDEVTGGTLYCSLVYFGPDGRLLGTHRKLKPTAAERIIWGEGDGTTLSTYDTPIGRIGGLICWENYMPLARMAMYNKGVEVYLAPTADHRPTWQSTIQHIALEGRCYVLAANQYVTKAMYPKGLPGVEDLKHQPEVLSKGGSAIIGPLGEVIAGPLWDEAGILYAELDPVAMAESKMDFDAAGHYQRPDVFSFGAPQQPPIKPVEWRK